MSQKENIEDSKALEAKALEHCNTDPIEWIGQIQGYGCLFAFDSKSLIVTHTSENIGAYLNLEYKQVLGSSIRSFLDRIDVHTILNVAAHSSTQHQREHVKLIEHNKLVFDVSLYRSDELVVVEFIPIESNFNYIIINSNVKWALAQTHGHHDMQTILGSAVESLKNITGFDRVMAYKFLPDNSGEVVAESLSPGTDSFLGMRFPAFDIPEKARELFLKNPIRIIFNTEKNNNATVKKSNEEGEGLNLSLSLLRAVAPVHVQYLKNMNVISSMSMPIVVDGKLWGLFAHHHRSQLTLTPQTTYSAEIIGQTVSMVLEHRLQLKNERAIQQLLETGNQLVSIENNKFKLEEYWHLQGSNLAALIPCDGVAFLIHGFVLAQGNCPTELALHALAKKLEQQPEEIVHFSDLSSFKLEGLGNTKGVLCIKINSENTAITLLFFRDAVSTKVQWAGKPEKQLVFEKEGVRLHPRSSFKEYQEEHSESSDEWTTEDLFMAQKVLATFKRYMVSKLIQQKQAVSESERLKILVKELNHRVRNILALVKSISKQTASNEKSIESYVVALEKRITALSNANNMLTESSFSKIGLRLLLQQELKPYVGSQVSISILGEEVELSSGVAPIIVLVFHELITNSNKYGALSEEDGKLFVSWQIDGENLEFFWREQDGPKVTPPERTGFGRTIIENAIEYEFGGETEVNFKETGLEVNYKIPLAAITRNDSDSFAGEQINAIDKNGNGKKFNILVLEDDFINANELKISIEKKLASKVYIFSNQKSALNSIKKVSYDLALLDVNLKAETSIDVAEACNELNIPFYYITGYGEALLDNDAFPKAPVFTKPINEDELSTLLKTFNHQ